MIDVTVAGDRAMVADAGLLAEVAELVPTLVERGAQADGLRRLPDETVADLERLGFPLLTRPQAYGGRQLPLLGVLGSLEELAQGCASTSFVAGVYATSAWMTTLFSEAAQDEVFNSPNPKTAITFTPAGGVLQQGDEYILSGRWPFASGHFHAGWMMVFALFEGPDGIPEIGILLVPRSEFQSADDWRVSGMAATGSDSLSCNEVVVPGYRVIRWREIEAGRVPDSVARQDPYYQAPILPFIGAMFTGTPLGLGEAAYALFRQKVDRRSVAYTEYFRAAEAPVTHFQMAEARIKLDHARFHSHRLVETAASGRQLDMSTRARCRVDMAWDAKLCREAVDIVSAGSGASSLQVNDPLVRIVRDMHALSLHAFLVPTTATELYGRVLCGIDPGAAFL